MILKRIEKDGIVKAIYKSSNILASKYDKNNKTLNVTFNRGTNYTYMGVSLTDYTRFEIAESQGKVLNTHIKQYETIKGDDIDPSKIINEINKCHEEEIIALESELISTMKKTVEFHEKGDGIEMSNLLLIQYIISKLYNEKNA